MNKARSMAYEAVIKEFDFQVDPSRLSRHDYKELLAELIGDLQSRLETAEQEDAEES